MNLLARLVLRHRFLVGLVIALAAAASLVGVTRLAFDDNYKDIFRSADVRYRDFQTLADVFGGGDGDCVIVLSAPDVLSREALAAIRAIHEQAQRHGDVESVASLHSARKPRRIGRLFPPLFPPDDAADEDFERAREAADKNPLVRGPLLSADHQASLVLVRLKSPSRPVEKIAPILDELRQIVERSTKNTELRGALTGMPAIRVETIRRLQREQLVISISGTLLATVVAWMLLRRLMAVAFVVLPALIGVLLTMGIVGLAGRNLNAINIVLPALVMVIGVSDSIHLMFHFRECRMLGQSAYEAALASIRDLGRACALTALTTSVGFLSLMTSEDQIIREFGLFGGIGVSVTFLVVVTLLPALCSTRLGNACTPRYAKPTDAHLAWPDRFLDWLQPRARLVVGGALVVAVLLGVVASRIRADYSFSENLTDSSEAYRTMRLAEEKFGGAPILQVLVKWPDAEGLRSQESLDVLAAAHAAIANSAVAKAPMSVYSLLQSLPGKDDDGLLSRFGELRHIPADRLRPMIADDQRLALITAYAPDKGAAAMRQPLDQLAADLESVEQQHPDYDLRLTGFAVLATYRTTPMIMNMMTGLTIELGVIFVVISLVLRSLSLGLLSIPSNVFPLIATAASLVFVGWPLQYASVLAFNICLGIAVDDTVHFLSRYQRELAATGDRLLAVRNSFQAVAPVMFTQTILMISGFGAGMFCGIPTIRAFSACSCTALVFALVSEVLIMPSLLFCLAWLPVKTAATNAGESVMPPASGPIGEPVG
jgi:uncharacterized protein